ncbi:rhamnogalacturonan acetylesterase [Brachybacterium sp. YJGR34]|uniref:rhamnogalacturonan acetylesterase n=1 Tax=Brachybacterium sp. YJGR34 TaxID=2059911 RepID=UPI000E0A7B0E|nr:rhamnogalacturonan acetylesterase [Brachybacterium sp. YJGR34]
MSAAERTLFLLGDSTVASYEPTWHPQAGWGQFLDRFVSGAVRVDNHAIGGRSARTFREEGRLAAVLERARPGDTALIQFGHNDSTRAKPERYSTPAQYREELRGYVAALRERGVQPVLVTAVSRRDHDPVAGRWAVSFPDYVAGARAVAAELDVPLVDLAASSRAHLERIGPDAAKDLFLHLEPGVSAAHPDGVADDTHFQERGAQAMAQLVAEELAGLDLPVSAHLAAAPAV